MKLALLALIAISSTACCYRHVRTAEDITPWHCNNEKLDWRYGAKDIAIQTTNVLGTLMDRWSCQGQRPRIVITDVDNCTDMYISCEMIRDIFEGVAANDGRFTVVVGDKFDEAELDQYMHKIQTHPKYGSKLSPGQATAPEFLAKVRITKAKTEQPFYTLEDYRMTITLYDIETQEIVDSYWDVLCKKVYR